MAMAAQRVAATKKVASKLQWSPVRLLVRLNAARVGHAASGHSRELPCAAMAARARASSKQRAGEGRLAAPAIAVGSSGHGTVGSGGAR